MKVEIDTVNKTMCITEGCTVDELLSFINAMNIKDYQIIPAQCLPYYPWSVPQQPDYWATTISGDAKKKE